MGITYTKRCTEKFKRGAIVLIDSSGKAVTVVARELGLSSDIPARLVPPGEGEPRRGRLRLTPAKTRQHRQHALAA